MKERIIIKNVLYPVEMLNTVLMEFSDYVLDVGVSITAIADDDIFVITLQGDSLKISAIEDVIADIFENTVIKIYNIPTDNKPNTEPIDEKNLYISNFVTDTENIRYPELLMDWMHDFIYAFDVLFAVILDYDFVHFTIAGYKDDVIAAEEEINKKLHLRNTNQYITTVSVDWQ